MKQVLLQDLGTLTELSPSLFPCITREVSDVLRERGTVYQNANMGCRHAYTYIKTIAQ